MAARLRWARGRLLRQRSSGTQHFRSLTRTQSWRSARSLRLLRGDPEGRLAQFAAAIDAKAGHPVTGDWSPYVEDDIVGLLCGDDALVQLGTLPGET